MKSSEKVILEKMIGYCDDIVSFLKKFNDSYEIYRSEKMLQYACNTCIIQIGELSARLSDDYERVDLAVMWQTLTNDIPELRKKLLKILQSMQKESEGDWV